VHPALGDEDGGAIAAHRLQPGGPAGVAQLGTRAEHQCGHTGARQPADVAIRLATPHRLTRRRGERENRAHVRGAPRAHLEDQRRRIAAAPEDQGTHESLGPGEVHRRLDLGQRVTILEGACLGRGDSVGLAEPVAAAADVGGDDVVAFGQQPRHDVAVFPARAAAALVEQQDGRPARAGGAAVHVGDHRERILDREADLRGGGGGLGEGHGAVSERCRQADRGEDAHISSRTLDRSE
jgi:hypothetical protein